MKASAETKRRRRVAAAASLCALLVSLAVAVAPALAEAGDSAPIRPISEGGFTFPEITGPEAPEEYPIRWGKLDPLMVARQVNDQEIVFEESESGTVAGTVEAKPAHDAVGATVPTSVKLVEDEEGPVVTEIVHFRAGNPAAGGAPFAFPITSGAGWEGGYRTISVEFTEPRSPAPEAPATSPPAPTCTVPTLRHLSLHAAKTRLRAAGQVHLARGSTQRRGRVVKQFRPAGTHLPAGAQVAVKLGA